VVERKREFTELTIYASAVTLGRISKYTNYASAVKKRELAELDKQ
jgi:hypothetical protein